MAIPRLAITPRGFDPAGAGNCDLRRRGRRRGRRHRFELADRLGDGRDAGRGPCFESCDHHLVAAANSQRHQRHGAARAGGASASADLDLVGQVLGDARDQCRGPRVDSVRMRDHQRFADHRRAGRGIAADARAQLLELEEWVAAA